jgi:hypothetical protein
MKLEMTPKKHIVPENTLFFKTKLGWKPCVRKINTPLHMLMQRN